MAYTGPKSFSYNPFTAQQSIYNQQGGLQYYQDPRTGQWYERKAVNWYGGPGTEWQADQFEYVPIDASQVGNTQQYGDTTQQLGSPTWDLGYSKDFYEKDPTLAADWGRRDSGNFLRDTGGYTNSQVTDYDPATKTYTVLQKTGDKEGTPRFFRVNDTGGVDFVGEGKPVPMDTNKNVTDQSAFNVAKVVAPFVGGAALSALNAGAGTLTAAQLANMSQAELAAMVESGLVGAAGSAIESAAVPGLDAFLSGTITAEQFIAQNPNFASQLASGNEMANAWDTGNFSDASRVGQDAPWDSGNFSDASQVGTDPFEANYPVNPSPTTNPVTPADYTTPPDWKPPPGTTAAERVAAGATTAGTTAAKGGSLAQSLANLTGMPLDAANLLLTTVPAIGALVSNLTSGDDTTTSTQGSPAQQAARDTIATTVTGRLPEYMARDRQRADQQMAWANAAALVPQGYTTPPPVFGANGTGMMGNYRPKGLFG